MAIPDTSPSSERRPAWMMDGMQVTLVEGREDLQVVGESFYQDSLWELVGGWTGGRVRQEVCALLVAEHDNKHDVNAISVWISGRKVGHLGREDAVRLRPGLLTLQRKHNRAIALAGQIVGGGADDGRTGMLGVFLDYDPTEFGVSAPRAARSASSGGVRTGLSQAMDTDEADDTYDLGWLSTLSGEPSKRLRQLRDLLQRDTDVVSRHYLFAELESTLYGLRDAIPTALAEYDSACHDHDAEMETIVPALVDKFGVVPLLETYRQAAIRHQKAQNFAQALWWAERGIALYRDNPAKSEMLVDLHKRAGTCRAKLERLAGGPG